MRPGAGRSGLIRAGVGFCLVLGLGILLAAQRDGSVPQSGFSGRVTVLDGDSMRIASTEVRLFGVDAPEFNQTCTNPDGMEWSCGRWAADEARRRFQGERAHCEAIETDRYGRTVASCRVGGQDIGRILVREGLAFAYRRYSMRYDLDEKHAVVQGNGLHGHQLVRPSEYRDSQRDNP